MSSSFPLPVSRTVSAAEQREIPADEAEFRNLFSEYVPRLHAFFRRRGADAASAEELVQEVMVSVWSHADRFDPAKGALSTWIYTIARNKHLDRIRRVRPEPDPKDPAWQGGPRPGPDEQSATNRRAARVRAAISELPAEHRALLAALYFEGKSMSEYARETGEPLGTIKSRARRALALLRASAHVEEEDP